MEINNNSRLYTETHKNRLSFQIIHWQCDSKPYQSAQITMSLLQQQWQEAVSSM